MFLSNKALVSQYQLNDTGNVFTVSCRESVLVSRIFSGFTATARSDPPDTRADKDKSGCPAWIPDDVGAARLHTWLYHGS